MPELVPGLFDDDFPEDPDFVPPEDLPENLDLRLSLEEYRLGLGRAVEDTSLAPRSLFLE